MKRISYSLVLTVLSMIVLLSTAIAASALIGPIGGYPGMGMGCGPYGYPGAMGAYGSPYGGYPLYGGYGGYPGYIGYPGVTASNDAFTGGITMDGIGSIDLGMLSSFFNMIGL